MLDVKQINWLRQATGASILIPLDLLPDPKDENPPLSDQEKLKKKTEARDEEARKETLRQKLAEQQRLMEERKQFVLGNAQRVIDPLKPALREAFDIGFEAEQQTKTLGISHKKKVKRDFIAKDGDVSKSGDTQDMQNAKLTKGGKELGSERDAQTGLSESDRVALAVDKAYGVLRNLQKELLAEMFDSMVPNKAGTDLEPGPKVKLFTQDEIIDELFDPLVRSKILPDAFIEDAYSTTQRMLDATNKLYKADLTDPTKFTGRGLADMGKGFVDMASGVCSCVLEATGLINANEYNVSDALTGATELAKLAIDTVDAIDTARRTEKFDKKGLTGILDQLPDIAGQIVGAVTNNGSLQKTVSSAATAGMDLVDAVIAHNFDETSKSLGDFLGLVGQAVVNGLAISGTESSDDKHRNTVISDFSKVFSTAMKDGAPVIAKLLIEGKFSNARGQFARLCLDAASQAPGVVSDIQVDKGATKDNITGFAEGDTVGFGSDEYTQNGTIEHTATKDFTQDQNFESDRDTDLTTDESSYEKSGSKSMQGAIDKTNPKDAPKGKQPQTPEQIEAKKKLEALKKQYQEEEETSLAEEIEADAQAELKAFKERMRGGDKLSRNQNTIDKMIADLKRDQAILSTLMAVGMGGAAIAGKFVSYVAIGAEAIQMAANAKLAYEKMRAMFEFKEELKGARETASAYGTAIDNFFANQKFQLTAASINVALNGVKLIVAAVAAAIPHAAPAVPAANALSSGVNAVLGGIKQSKLKKSWQATKKALQNPKNRRLGLKARKMNPTLAKYTIAYGAMEEDPIAVSMALACGLNEKTLKNPSANVAKVKQYLEAKFPDDGTVVGYWEEEKGWEGELPEPKLTTVTLSKLYKVVGKQFPTIGVVPPGPLAGLVSMVTKPLPKDAPVEDWQQRSELLKQLDDMFTAVGKEAATTAGSRKLAEVFAEFADLAAEAGFEAWTKTVPPAKEDGTT
jgi:hypothetical protein